MALWLNKSKTEMNRMDCYHSWWLKVFEASCFVAANITEPHQVAGVW